MDFNGVKQDAPSGVLQVLYIHILNVFSVTAQSRFIRVLYGIFSSKSRCTAWWSGFIFSVSGSLHHPHSSITVMFYVTLAYLLCIHPPFPLPSSNCLLLSYSHHLFFSHVKCLFALFSISFSRNFLGLVWAYPCIVWQSIVQLKPPTAVSHMSTHIPSVSLPVFHLD